MTNFCTPKPVLRHIRALRHHTVRLNVSASAAPRPPSAGATRDLDPDPGPDPAPRRPRVYAGGKGPLSAEFLSVSGTFATCIAIVVATVVAFASTTLRRLAPLHSLLLPSTVTMRAVAVAASSFTSGLLLQRFELRKATRLRLTMAFSILARFIFIPALSHIVATAGYAFVARIGMQSAATGAPATAAATSAGAVTATTAAAAAAAAAAAQIGVHAPQTATVVAQATADSLSLPAGVLSSLFLLSTTPPMLSAPVAMLASHVHATLLAALLAATHVLFPLLPGLSHAVSLRAHASLLNFGSLLPRVTPPPPVGLLAAATTAPFCAGVALNRVLPPRAAGLTALIALPVSWTLSLFLLLGALRDIAAAGVTGLVGSCGLCLGVVLMMLLLGNILARALLLQRRARRTLLVYLCAQGCAAGAGLSPPGCAASAHVAAAAVGLLVAFGMGVVWRHVIIRTKADMM